MPEYTPVHLYPLLCTPDGKQRHRHKHIVSNKGENNKAKRAKLCRACVEASCKQTTKWNKRTYCAKMLRLRLSTTPGFTTGFQSSSLSSPAAAAAACRNADFEAETHPSGAPKCKRRGRLRGRGGEPVAAAEHAHRNERSPLVSETRKTRI